MEKIKYWLTLNCLRIGAAFFYGLFIVVSSIHFLKFPFSTIPIWLSYLFWLSVGLYGGVNFGVSSMRYLKNRKRN